MQRAGWHDEGFNWRALAGVAVLHAGVGAALLAYTPTREALTDAIPLLVRVIEPEPPRRVEPLTAPPPPKPRPVEIVRRAPPPAPPPIVAVPEPTPAPAPIVVPPPPPVVELPPVLPLPAPAAPPAPIVAVAPPAPAPAPAPAPITPPNFNAAYLSNPAPAYPASSRRMGEEGAVMLRVFVEPNGEPSRVELDRTSGHPRLDQSAIDAVRRWKFVPAKQGERAIAAWVLVPIQFKLGG
jgi:periplasmic protein TonB